jgi:hypothetical protein
MNDSIFVTFSIKFSSKDLSGLFCRDRVCYNSAIKAVIWTLKGTSCKILIVLEVPGKKIKRLSHFRPFSGHFKAKKGHFVVFCSKK